MADSRPGRSSDQFALRFPDGLRDRIKAAADANERSMNSEIVSTLAEHYPVIADLSEDDFHAVIDKLQAALYSFDLPREQLDFIWNTLSTSLIITVAAGRTALPPESNK